MIYLLSNTTKPQKPIKDVNFASELRRYKTHLQYCKWLFRSIVKARFKNTAFKWESALNFLSTTAQVQRPLSD